MGKSLTSHELARLLLTLPDLPVATQAMNHTYMGATDAASHGPLKVGLLRSYGGDHIVIGDISKRNINPPNWHVSQMFHGDAPDEWRWLPCAGGEDGGGVGESVSNINLTILAVELAINDGEWSAEFKLGAATGCEEIAYRLGHPEAPWPLAKAEAISRAIKDLPEEARPEVMRGLCRDCWRELGPHDVCQCENDE